MSNRYWASTGHLLAFNDPSAAAPRPNDCLVSAQRLSDDPTGPYHCADPLRFHLGEQSFPLPCWQWLPQGGPRLAGCRLGRTPSGSVWREAGR
jgi:hypothetical protein